MTKLECIKYVEGHLEVRPATNNGAYTCGRTIKGLEGINDAAKKCDMSKLSGAVETVQAKFSALEVVAMTALANITNSAVNAGKAFLKSLSTDNIKSGWDKYADKTKAVGTFK